MSFSGPLTAASQSLLFDRPSKVYSTNLTGQILLNRCHVGLSQDGLSEAFWSRAVSSYREGIHTACTSDQISSAIRRLLVSDCGVLHFVVMLRALVSIRLSSLSRLLAASFAVRVNMGWVPIFMLMLKRVMRSVFWTNVIGSQHGICTARSPEALQPVQASDKISGRHLDGDLEPLVPCEATDLARASERFQDSLRTSMVSP